jgi:hypothetical protein
MLVALTQLTCDIKFWIKKMFSKYIFWRTLEYFLEVANNVINHSPYLGLQCYLIGINFWENSGQGL